MSANENESKVNEKVNQQLEGQEGDSQDIVELGDRILIYGGPLDLTRGRVFYWDGEILRILTDNVSDRLVSIEFSDGAPREEYQITSIAILDKRAFATFVELQSLTPGQYIETFTSAQPPDHVGPTFTVDSVDTVNDSAVFLDSTGQQYPIEFGFMGIPREKEFIVLRVREKSPEEAEEEADEDEAAAAADDLSQAQSQDQASSNSEDNEENLFEIIGTIEIPAIPQIQEVPVFKQIYNTKVQAADMIQDMLRMEDPAAQKNPKTLVKIRKLVEICILLRNELIDYSATQRPEKEIKTTSVETLLDLLEGDVPLAKPVLDSVRLLFLDREPLEGQPLKGLKVEMLANVVKDSIRYMASNEQIPVEEGAKPAFLLKWEGYSETYFRSWRDGGSQPKIPFKKDTDFLEFEAPDIEIATIPGLPKPGLGEGRSKYVSVSSDSAGLIKLGVLRGLTARKGRPTVIRGEEIITAAEEAAIRKYILFPFTEMRSLGATRSGNLAVDSARSLLRPKTLKSIFESHEGIQNAPQITVDQILAIGVGKKTVGNLKIEEFLKRLPSTGYTGLGHYQDLFTSLGLQKYELTQGQQDVLQEQVNGEIGILKDILRQTRATVDAIEPPALQPFLKDPEGYARFMKVLAAEPLLNDYLQLLKSRMPLYDKVDLTQYAFLLDSFQDYVDATISGNPEFLGLERIRAVRDLFLKSVREAQLVETYKKNAGEAPVPNTCKHVAEYVKIMKVDDKSQKMRLLSRFIDMYKDGDTEDQSHYSCTVCNLKLICKHEVLLVNEFFHPNEGPTLHKELLLNYSGGQFQGQYICSLCGQSIGELEYDTSLERDDNGAPMMGRDVLVDRDQIEDEAIEEAIGVPVVIPEGLDLPVVLSVGGYKFKKICGQDNIKPFSFMQCIYMVANDLFTRVGITANKESYQFIVSKVQTEILKQDDRETYTKKTAGKKVPDYDVYLNRILVCSTAAFLLIDIQSHIPEYIVRSTLEGCRASFKGFPRGPEADKSGIEYISCALASIMKDKAPYNLTGFQKEKADKKRQQLIANFLFILLKGFSQDANIQQSFVQKNKYLSEVLGRSEGEGRFSKELLPPSFYPLQFSDIKEAAESEIVLETASSKERFGAWIRKAHIAAKKTTNAIEGSPFSETSCCFVPIQKPGSFWAESGLPFAAPASKPEGSKGSRLFFHYDARKIAPLPVSIPEDQLYSVFMKVCFRGARIGFKHELGLTYYCPWCKTQFPTDTELSGRTDNEVYDLNKQSLIKQGISAEELKETFNEVLDTSHLNYRLPTFQRKAFIQQPAFFIKLRDLPLKSRPYDRWPDVFTACLEGIEKLKKDALDDEQLNAWAPMIEKSEEHRAGLEARLGKDVVDNLIRLCNSPPAEVRSNLITYIIVPFQRILSKWVPGSNLEILESYKLSDLHKEDISKILKDHEFFQSEFVGTFTSDLLKDRAIEFLGRLIAFQKEILPNVRKQLLFIGGKTIIPYFIRSFLLGMCYEYADLNRVSPGSTVVNAGENSSENIRKSLKLLSECIQQFYREMRKLKLTDEQVRVLIARRNEKEKKDFVNELKAMTPEDKRIELMNKKLGLGKWAVGGTKAIRIYNQDRYDQEREERHRAGIMDHAEYGPEGPGVPQGRAVEGGFLNFGNAYEGDGYDRNQQREEDY